MPKEPAVLVRRSSLTDLPALACLAAASGRSVAAHGRYLVAEVRGQIVAAAPLEGRAAPFRSRDVDTSAIEELLTRWASNLRRQSVPTAKAA